MKTVLYLGTDCQFFAEQNPQCQITHYPLIRIEPRSVNLPQISQAYSQFENYTHVIFTSKQAVCVFFEQLSVFGKAFKEKTAIAVGPVTASYLAARGVSNLAVADQETQEGVIALLQTLDLKQAFLFVPHSARSRPVLFNWLKETQILHCSVAIYDTVFQGVEPQPNWEDYDEVLFTSPSTVEAFLCIFGQLPPASKCRAIGPITDQALKDASDRDRLI